MNSAKLILFFYPHHLKHSLTFLLPKMNSFALILYLGLLGDKLLTLGKLQINLHFHSFIRNFAEI